MLSTNVYFVKPKLNDKKLKQYRKKSLIIKKNLLNGTADLALVNDELDDENFKYSHLKYPIHPIPIQIYQQIPKNQLVNLPHETENPIIRNKYTTSVDSRNCFTTFEYKINNQSIIWDYNTGYVHLTGIWKALGNSKADILNLLDNAPELEPYLKRVRGGFLKIQGSWLNYDNCYKLACKICWDIRFCLVPIFGVQFLHDVLKPTDFGYGELKLNSYLPGDPNDKTNENKKKRKRITQKLKAENSDSEASPGTAGGATTKKPKTTSGIKKGRKPKQIVTESSLGLLSSSSSPTMISFHSSIIPNTGLSTSSSIPNPTPFPTTSSSQRVASAPSKQPLSHDEYNEMILASDSLRKLKYASSAHRTAYKAYRSSSLPNESAIISDNENENELESSEEIHSKAARPVVPTFTTLQAPNVYNYYSHPAPLATVTSTNANGAYNYGYNFNRKLLTPSPPIHTHNGGLSVPSSASSSSSSSYSSSSMPVMNLANKHNPVESLLAAANKLSSVTGKPLSTLSSLTKYSLNGYMRSSTPGSSISLPGLAPPATATRSLFTTSSVEVSASSTVGSDASPMLNHAANAYMPKLVAKMATGETKPVTSAPNNKMDIKGLIS